MSFHPSKTLPVGLKPNTPPKEYHSLGVSEKLKRGDPGYVMSRSELWAFAQQPSKWRRGVTKETTDAMEYGSLLDCMYLTPDLFDKLFAVAPDHYLAPATKAPGAPLVKKPWSRKADACDEWELDKEEQGLTVVSNSDVADAIAAMARLDEDPEIVAARQFAKTSVLACADYHDEATGLVVPFKSLIDIVPTTERFLQWLIDLKSAARAAGFIWTKSVFDSGYHYQGGVYLDIYNVSAPEEGRIAFGQIVSESTAPFETAKRFLSTEYIELGRAQYKRDLELYCRCVAENQWPGYSQESGTRLVLTGGWHVVEPTPWMMERAHSASFTLEAKAKNGPAAALAPDPEPYDEVIP